MILRSRLIVKYIAPTAPVGITILFRKPRLSFVENLFTLTFDKSTWIAIGVLIFLSLIFFYGVIRMENKYKRFQSVSIFNVIRKIIITSCKLRSFPESFV